MLKKSKLTNDDNKRVYGKFMLQFNLKKILSNIQKLASMEKTEERNLAIRKKSMGQTGMQGVETLGNDPGSSTIAFNDGVNPSRTKSILPF